jgi:hypothetical protein
MRCMDSEVKAASYQGMLYAKLRHIPRSELLDAMKESLRKLSGLKLLSPDDLAILPLKRNLKAQIAELERDL